MNCKSKDCNNDPNGMNGYCHECTETGLNKILSRLRAEPYAKEREELGVLLMKRKDDLTETELKRYNELQQILKD